MVHSEETEEGRARLASARYLSVTLSSSGGSKHAIGLFFFDGVFPASIFVQDPAHRLVACSMAASYFKSVIVFVIAYDCIGVLQIHHWKDQVDHF